MRSVKKLFHLGFLISLSLGPALAWAQNVATGVISGQVTDQTGAAIPGANVKLTEISTNSTTNTSTNETGRFTFPNVAPGRYDVTVTKEGFALSKVAAQKVDVGMSLTVNVALELGQTTTLIDVAAVAGAELQVTNATVGSTITGDTLQYLPNLGRDASTLATLQVGVTAFGNAAGANQDQNSFQLDGGNNSSDMDGNQRTYTPSNGYTGTSSTGGAPSGVIPTPVESIEEFKIGTSNQTADFAGAAGSQVQMVTKRGTNTFHGAAYEHYFASNVGGANFWKNNHTPSGNLPYTPLPVTHRNRYGFSGGGPVSPNVWGGKTYIFGNYEGFRFPQTTTFEKAVPSVLLRNGIVQIPNAAGVYQPYNLNSDPVTVNGVTYQPATCSNGAFCDPRGIGFNPIVKQIWNTMMPLPNDPQYIVSGASDGVNQQGYLANISLPQSSDFFVTRLDHDFGNKWKFTSSYRYFRFKQLATTQVDIGGVLPGDRFGVPASSAPRPQKPWFWVAGLTTTISSNLTNDFRASYLRNYWEWSTVGGPPQLPGLGGAVELGGETAAVNALIPYNVDAQNTRSRFWDGQDWLLRDDLTWLRGNHLLQFGGTYQRNFDYHQRNDNGVGIDTSPVYQITNGTGVNFTNQPANLPASQVTNWNNLYAQVLGIVSQPQVMYTRSGSSLMLNPPLTPGFDQSIIPTYNLYFSDTWHMRPAFTLTYGLSYTLEMPPYEINGKQVGLTDQSGKPIVLTDFLTQKKNAALAGQVYNPTVGFATVRNMTPSRKYPFDPFYGGWSPRVAAAWNPSFDKGLLGNVFGAGKTVVRGGYSRIYGRLNGVGLVLVPLLGTGLLQPVSCIGASRTGQCLGNGGVDPTTAFRIGVDSMSAPLPAVSQTLPQPYVPGVSGNAAAGDGSQLDPKLKPSHSDEINFTVQRALSSKLVIEAGYIGRRIRDEFQEINIDAVPYMTTLGGQSYANAYASVYSQLSSGIATPTAQPFFETALGGANSAYCAKFASCTAAVATNLKSSITSTQVYNLWNSLSAAPSWTLGRTLLSSPAVGGSSVASQLASLEYITSLGWGNYNAAFVSFTAKDWHGITARSNFTWSRSMGTGSLQQSSSSITVVDPWNLHAAYGPQPFDIRFIYNQLMVYQSPFFKDQRGITGRLLGSWSISPLFTAQSGAPLQVNVGTGSNSDAQAFGEIYGNNNRAYENAVLIAPYKGGNSLHHNVSGSGGVGVNGSPARGGSGLNIFGDPAATYALFRRPILGLDTTGGGAGVLRGFPSWSLDTTVSKEIRASERFGATLIIQVTNVLNHFQPENPTLNIDSPQTWGVVTDQSTVGSLSGIGGTARGVPTINPRQMEFGLRIHF